jgi:DNA-binding winged helix-turn-helix (wHTH) protein/pimeloyl-ACP methyl ester carboxylesterase
MKADVYRFGPFELSAGEHRLLRDGQPVALRGKLFDTLRVLVENAGRLVKKEDLLRRVWPDTVVEENNLNHNISQLRRTLGGKESGQTYIETVPRVGYRFVAPVRAGRESAAQEMAGGSAGAGPGPDRQQIRFCTARDGVRIAYSTTGNGYPLVKAANWLNHLEFEWNSPIWAHWIRELSARHLLVRYDERGNGLSDWNVEDLSFGAWVDDLETVVEAAGLERFALLGISQGGAVAAAYAARHPERVSHLVLYGTYARGWTLRGDPEDMAARQALLTLVGLGWGRNNAAFRQLWTSRFIPGAAPEQWEWFNELQRISAPPANAARFMEEFGRIDVRDVLSSVDEGRRLAAAIPGARFVPLPGQNHLMLSDEPAWPLFLEETGRFLGWHGRAGEGRAGDYS